MAKKSSLTTNKPKTRARQGARKPNGLSSITGKLGQVAEAVAKTKGATLDELIATTGWQRHTIRAALTRLRQRGIDAQLSTVGGRKAYRPNRASA